MKIFPLTAKNRGKNSQLPQIMVILAASLPGLSSGLLFAWTSPTIPKLIEDSNYNINLEEASYLTVITALSMAVSAVIYPKIISKIGLRKTVLVISIPQLLAWTMIAFAKRIEIFYLARVVAGMGDAGLFGVVPFYACEIAEAKVRDRWCNAVAFSIFIGIFLINVIGAYFSIMTTALICLVVPVIHIIIFMFVPESPYYLLTKNQKQKANQSLQLLRWREDVDEELEQMEIDIKRQISESGKLKDLFTIVSNRKAFIICLGLRTIQQFSGLTAFESYTQYLFQQVGGEVSETISSIAFSGVLMLSVISFSMVNEKLNRKSMLVFSCFGCAFCLAMECIYLGLIRYTTLDLSSVSWVSLMCLLGFIICEGSLGVIPTVIIGEMFPASVKSKASFIINICFAVYVLVVPKLFQVLTSNFGVLYALLFFVFCCFFGGIFCYFCIIETKGKTLEEIQQALKCSTKSQQADNEC